MCLVLGLVPWHDDGMGEIVNLRRARKAKTRDAAAAVAEENRRRSGLTKAERRAVESERLARERVLDGARIDEPDPTR